MPSLKLRLGRQGRWWRSLLISACLVVSPSLRRHRVGGGGDHGFGTRDRGLASRNQQPETSNQRPATRDQQPETSTQQPATRDPQLTPRSKLIHGSGSDSGSLGGYTEPAHIASERFTVNVQLGQSVQHHVKNLFTDRCKLVNI